MIRQNNYTTLDGTLSLLGTNTLQHMFTWTHQGGENLLQVAVEYKSVDCVKVLLKYNIPPCLKMAQNERKMKMKVISSLCPIQLAVLYCHKGLVLTLLKHGADPNCYHDHIYYGTPLFNIVTKLGNRTTMDIAKILVYHNASLRTKPPLLYLLLCSKGCLNSLQFFIGVGVDFVRDARNDVCRFIDVSTYNVLLSGGDNVAELLAKCGVDVYKRYRWMSNQIASNNSGRLRKDDSCCVCLALQDLCRIVIRQRLIRNSNGRFILPKVKRLPLPSTLKEFISFGTLLHFMEFSSNINVE